jgi:FkbM family methyltransferase
MREVRELKWRHRALRGLLRAVPRGRYRLLQLLAPAHGRALARLADDLGGATFEADLADALSREVCFTGIYEPPISRVLQRHVPPGGVVVDAGANWGYFSLIAAAACGDGGSVTALEPDPRQFAALTRNVALNAFTHVRAIGAAAAAREGTLTLLGYGDTESNRGVSRLAAAVDTPATGPRFEVAAMTIDAITGAAPVVDLVKIDVEGAEDGVLEGMRQGLMAQRYRAILLELHPPLLRERGVDPDACIRVLQDAGYRGWTIDASPAAYRAAIDPAVPVERLLRPIDEWTRSAWPHLLWLC